MKYLIPFTVLFLVVIFGSLGLPSVSQDKSDSPDQEHLASEIVSEMTDCSQLSPQLSWQCLKVLAKKLHHTYSLRDILAAIDAARDERVIFDYCHRLGHLLGRGEYKRTQSIPEALEHTSFVCESASIHGIVEGYIMEQNWPEITHEKLTEFVTTICQPVYAGDRSNNQVYEGCLHGIGHALMFITGNNLPLSLELCDALSVQDNARTCYSGIFMENNIGVSDYEVTASGHISEYLSRPDDPLYPCSILEERYLPLCYEYKADFSLRATVGDFDEAIELCLAVPNEYQSPCFYKIGESAPHWIPEYNGVKTVCDRIYSLTGVAFRSRCIEGVVSAITWKYGGDANEVDLFCSLFEKKGEERECHDLTLRFLSEWAASR